MDRAHIRSGALVKLYNGEKGWLALEGGKRASPVTLGFVDGNDMVVPVVDELVDNSTGSDSITEVTTDWAIQTKPDRYYRQRTRRDKTAKELTDSETGRKNALNQLFDDEPAIKSLFDLCWRVQQGNIPASATANKTAFRRWFKDNLL